MAVIKSKSEWPLVVQEANMKKGKLIRVEIAPGRFVKKYASDVAASKAAVPDGNKLAPIASENKTTIEPGSDDPAVVFDPLTEIKGIGKASERLLNENGIYTFDQLAVAGELTYLSASINEKIQAWRDGRLNG